MEDTADIQSSGSSLKSQIYGIHVPVGPGTPGVVKAIGPGGGGAAGV